MSNILTFNRIVEVLKDIADRHLLVKSYYLGKNWEVTNQNNDGNLYPLFQFYPNFAKAKNNGYGDYNTIDITLNCKILDLTLQGKENEKDVISDTLQIAQDIITEISQNPYFQRSGLQVIDDIQLNNLEEYNDDFTAGWEFEMILRLKMSTAFCSLPIEDITGYSYSGPVSTGYTYNTSFMPIGGGVFTGPITGTCATFGCFSATTISGNTIYLSGVSLTDTFLNINAAIGSATTIVQPGSNIITGGTIINPVISLVSSPSVQDFTASGNTILNYLTANTISATTYLNLPVDTLNAVLTSGNTTSGKNIILSQDDIINMGTGNAGITNVNYIADPDHIILFTDSALTNSYITVADGNNVWLDNTANGFISTQVGNNAIQLSNSNDWINVFAGAGGINVYGNSSFNNGITGQTLNLQALTSDNTLVNVLVKDSNGEVKIASLTNYLTTTGMTSNRTILNSLSSGLISGCTVSINGSNPAEIDITPGQGIIVDNWTDLNNPVVYSVDFTGVTAQSLTYLSSSTITHLSIDKNGVLLQFPSEESNSQRRDSIMVGQINHPSFVDINNTNAQVDLIQAPISQLRDLMNAIKFINTGNIISANGANMLINKSAGVLFGQGINFSTDIKNPHVKSYSATTVQPFLYRTQTGGTTTSVTVIDPTNYDLNGVITSVGGGNRATNQRVFLYPNGVIVIQYGQQWYSNLTLAIAGLQTESFIKFENVDSDATLIGIISIQQNCTSLTDTTKVAFFSTSKFGEVAGAAAGAATTSLQQAYDVSVQPQILTSSSLGSVQFKNGAGSDTNINLFEGLNSGGTITSSIRPDGLSKFTTLTATTISGSTLLINSLASGTAFLIRNSAGNQAFRMENSDLKARFYAGGGINYPSITFNGTNADNGLGCDSSERISVITNNKGRIFVDKTTGYVGIGAITQSYLLDVTGTTRTNGLSAVTISSNTISATSITANTAVFSSTVNFTEKIVNNKPQTLKGYTVATLPAGTQGDIAFVTDATAPSYLVTVVGGGAVITPVFYNGTNWVAH